MDVLISVFGQGKDLTLLQMATRSIVVFFIALVLIRFSGRRSFGLHTPLDSIITIVLGAVLSRAIVGASAFLPVIGACTMIVFLHRLLGWIISHSPRIGMLVEGNKRLLYENGEFIEDNIKKALLCKEDILQGVRKSVMTENLATIDKIYMERTGEISVIKKS